MTLGRMASIRARRTVHSVSFSSCALGLVRLSADIAQSPLSAGHGRQRSQKHIMYAVSYEQVRVLPSLSVCCHSRLCLCKHDDLGSTRLPMVCVVGIQTACQWSSRMQQSRVCRCRTTTPCCPIDAVRRQACRANCGARQNRKQIMHVLCIYLHHASSPLLRRSISDYLTMSFSHELRLQRFLDHLQRSFSRRVASNKA